MPGEQQVVEGTRQIRFAGRPCCLNCHFLQKQHPPPAGQMAHSLVLKQDDRNRLARGESPESVVGSDCVLGCHHNVWDWANLPPEADRNMLLSRDRGTECFYYPYTPGMFFPAAAELERRVADRREAEHDRKLTRKGIIGAFLGVILTIIFTPIVTNLFDCRSTGSLQKINSPEAGAAPISSANKIPNR